MARGRNVKQCLSRAAIGGKKCGVSHDNAKPLTREERLAAKLRENLRRRKAQGRAMARETEDGESRASGVSKEDGKS